MTAPLADATQGGAAQDGASESRPRTLEEAAKDGELAPQVVLLIEINTMKRGCLNFINAAFINVGYTRYNLYAFILCICTGFKWVDLYAIVTCTSWGIFLSFYSSLLVDRTAFRRIAESIQMSMCAFHAVDFLMHILPCILTVCIRASSMFWWHGLIAAVSHLSWGLIRSNGTLQMDALYVPMSKCAWYFMWTVGCVTEVAVGLTPLW